MISSHKILYTHLITLSGLQLSIQMKFNSDMVAISFHRRVGKHWTTLPREAVEPPPLQVLTAQVLAAESSQQPHPAKKLNRGLGQNL